MKKILLGAAAIAALALYPTPLSAIVVAHVAVEPAVHVAETPVHVEPVEEAPVARAASPSPVIFARGVPSLGNDQASDARQRRIVEDELIIAGLAILGFSLALFAFRRPRA